MVSPSLNFASLFGLALVAYTFPAALAALLSFRVPGIVENENNFFRVLSGLWGFAKAFGRSLCLPVAGLIFFFQGWRLAPVLQLVVVILCLGLFAESFSKIVSEYVKSWKYFNSNRAKSKTNFGGK